MSESQSLVPVTATGPGSIPIAHMRAVFRPGDVSRKLDRLPKLREIMRESLVASAAMLDTVPANEQMVLSVALPRYHWEDTSGLPAQIVMQATRGALVHLQVNPSADGNWRIAPVPGVRLTFLSASTAQRYLAGHPQVRLIKDNGDGSSLYELVP